MGKALSTSEQWQDSTVRAGPLVIIPGLLLELGCDPDAVFEKAGFKRSDLEDSENRISYLLGSRLMAECVAVTNCECFGLLLGRMASPSHLGLAGFLVRAASTVGQALEALVENLDLHDEGGTLFLQSEEDYSLLSFRVHQPGVSAVEQIYDLSAVLMYKVMRSLCGGDWKASEVLLPRRRPRELKPHMEYFRTAIIFNSESCGILFPSHCLRLVPPSADELLYHHLKLEADVLHEMQHNELMDALPVMLQRGLLLDRCSASDIANTLGLHVRTLHRRLLSAGTSFRRELDHVRQTLSLQLLESTSLPVGDIATALGYADSSGFIRAFRRWTGFSPASWRKQNKD